LRHSKLKARDIIPGWPRGRSTECAHRFYWMWFPYPLLNQGLLCVDDYWRAAVEEEVRLTREYHEQQQAMVDEFRRAFGYQDAFTRPDASEGTFTVARWLVNRQETFEYIERLINPSLLMRSYSFFADRGC